MVDAIGVGIVPTNALIAIGQAANFGRCPASTLQRNRDVPGDPIAAARAETKAKVKATVMTWHGFERSRATFHATLVGRTAPAKPAGPAQKPRPIQQALDRQRVQARKQMVW